MTGMQARAVRVGRTPPGAARAGRPVQNDRPIGADVHMATDRNRRFGPSTAQWFMPRVRSVPARHLTGSHREPEKSQQGCDLVSGGQQQL